MLTPYLVLGLSPGASAAEIRERYLELVRRHPPSRDPERFQRIAAAYEMLGDERARERTAIFGVLAWADFELALSGLVEAGAGQRQSPGLARLIEAVGAGDE